MTIVCAVCGTRVEHPFNPFTTVNKRWICHHCFSSEDAKRLMEQWDAEEEAKQ